MRKNKKIIILLSGILAFQFFAPKTRAHAKGLIINYDITEGVNIRESGSSSNNSKIIGGIDYPDVYEIKEEDNDWYKIDFKDKEGYVGKSWFYVLDDVKTLDKGKIYEKADEKSKEVSDFKKDEKLILVNFADKDFIKVKKGDKTGFIKIDKSDLSKKDSKNLDKIKDKYKKIYYSIKRYMDYLDRNNLSLYPVDEKNKEVQGEINRIYQENDSNNQAYDDSGNEVEYVYYAVDGDDIGSKAYNFATNFIGNPYVWGGTSLTNGVDCSGFTQQVYGKFGIGLPHFAQSQADYGKTVNLGEEKAGDLVFFGTSMSNITHVAIADGQGGIVHAANPRDGIITSGIGNPIIIKRLIED
ncbi:SH3 domain-containing C40 family peptidase [Anaerococcus hydrogenalis]|uniref:C40 family peptidase n=1 Tax=Anaerococcus hydrogenalis TaxID=33029 RepID=UPI001D36B82F|nr:SH3 domain-containing C40 family peptidase [Anaerococcus hydrogenalis]MBS5988782.1 C40 family peptidase [Anaerococcus hydrogenalis]